MPIRAASSACAFAGRRIDREPVMSGSLRAALERWQSAIAGLRGWRRAGLALIAGSLATAALPPVYVLPLLLLSFPLLVWLIDGTPGAKSAFGVGWWFGVGYFVFGLYWLADAFLVDAARFAWMIPFATLALPMVLGLFTGAASAVARWFWRPGPGRVIVLALAWTGAEWLRGHVLTGFPWNLLGYVWTVSGPVMQSAALFGAYGLSLVTVAVAAVPAVLAGRDLRTPRGLAPAAAAVATLLVMWGAGAARMNAHPTEVVPGVRLRIVQANVDQKEKWLPEKMPDNFVRYLNMTEAPGLDTVTTVIWPETAVPYFLSNEPSRRVLIGRVVGPGRLVLTGAPRIRRGPGEDDITLWNSFHVIDAHGRILATYDKTHLVPFGEYLPWRRLMTALGIAKLAVGDVDFTPGPGLKTITVPGLPPFVPLICYEGIFPGAVVPSGLRPAWLLNLTNDAWYGPTAGPYQHFEMVRLRAVEEGLALVRAAGTGISGVVDPLGRVTGKLRLGRRGLLDRDLPAALPTLTPFARWGDRVLLAIYGLLIALLWASGRGNRRQVGDPT